MFTALLITGTGKKVQWRVVIGRTIWYCELGKPPAMPSAGGYGVPRARVENVLLWRAAIMRSDLRT